MLDHKLINISCLNMLNHMLIHMSCYNMSINTRLIKVLYNMVCYITFIWHVVAQQKVQSLGAVPGLFQHLWANQHSTTLCNAVQRGSNAVWQVLAAATSPAFTSALSAMCWAVCLSFLASLLATNTQRFRTASAVVRGLWPILVLVLATALLRQQALWAQPLDVALREGPAKKGICGWSWGPEAGAD